MCIKVFRDEQLQARSCARTHRPTMSWRGARTPFIDALIGAGDATGGVLLTPDAQTPLVGGDVPACALPRLRAMQPPPMPMGAAALAEVELRCSSDEAPWAPLAELAQDLHTGEAIVLVLREAGAVAAWVVLIDAPYPDAARARSLKAVGRALLNHLRVEREAQAATLQAQRLEDVAYASGDWVWETDATHRYTWVLRDATRDVAGDATPPQVGQFMPPGQVVDWVGEPMEPPQALREVLDQHQPIVRLVTAEPDARGMRYVSRSAVPVLDANGQFCGYRGCARDVTQSVQAKLELWQREHQLAQMTLAKEQAEASSRAKSVLVSKVGHELRTPLNAIVGLAQLIRATHRPESSGTPVDRWVDQIARTGWHMADAIEMLMELGRSASGRLHAGGAGFAVGEVLAEATRIVEHDAKRRGITVAVEGDLGAMLHADRRAVRQVFVNLLSNAIKYNVDRGSVHVAVRCERERMRIAVRDSGPGLTLDQRGRLFQPFDRLGAEGTEVQGHGLGLLLCRELVVAMGGTVEVDSAVGEGCTFTVVLPVPSTRPAPAGPGSARGELVLQAPLAR